MSWYARNQFVLFAFVWLGIAILAAFTDNDPMWIVGLVASVVNSCAAGLASLIRQQAAKTTVINGVYSVGDAESLARDVEKAIRRNRAGGA